MAALRKFTNSKKHERRRSKKMTYTPLYTDVADLVMEHGGPTLMGIWTLAVAQSETFHVSIKFLTEKTSLNEKTVSKYIKQLAQIGLAKLQRGKEANGDWAGTRWVFSDEPIWDWLDDEWKERLGDHFSIENGETTFGRFQEPSPQITTNINIKNITNIKTNNKKAPPTVPQMDLYDSDSHSRPAKASVSVETPKVIPRAGVTEEQLLGAFKRFYEAYPRKLDKKRAYAVFHRMFNALGADKFDSLVDAIVQNVEHRKTFDAQWLRTIRTNMASIPYPKAYLAGERWNDVWEVSVSASRKEKNKPLHEDMSLETYVKMGGCPHEWLATFGPKNKQT